MLHMSRVDAVGGPTQTHGHNADPGAARNRERDNQPELHPVCWRLRQFITVGCTAQMGEANSLPEPTAIDATQVLHYTGTASRTGNRSKKELPLAQSALNTATEERRTGTLAGVLSAFAYSTAVLWVRYAYAAGLDPGTAIFLRFAIASAVLIMLLKSTRRWISLDAGEARRLFMLGLLTYTFMGIGWFTALSMIPAWLVSLFVALFPLPITVGSWLFLRERLGPRQVWALAAAVVGGAALVWRPLDGATWPGVLLMLLVVTMNALYVLVGQRWTRGTKASMTAVYTTLGAACGTFVYAVLSAQLGFDFDPVGWLWAGLLAVVSTAVSIVLLWESMARIGASRTAIIGVLEPLFSILLSVLILGERITLLQAAGGGLILVGVLLVQFPDRGCTDA